MISSTSLISQFVVLVVVAVVFQGAEAKPPSKIVGGSYADIGEFPFQVSLRKNDKHVCGGTIISKRHILTAAHCIINVSKNPSKDMSVVTGTNLITTGAGNKNHIKSVTVHPAYSTKREDSWINDIAIIALDKDLIFDELTKTAELPSENTQPKWDCLASGWGDMLYPLGILPDKLRRMKATTVENEECGKLHPNIPIYESQLCAVGNKIGIGLCSGDSGGPLFYNGEVHGIASWITPCGMGIPDVFTRVYYYLDFIRETMAST